MVLPPVAEEAPSLGFTGDEVTDLVPASSALLQGVSESSQGSASPHSAVGLASEPEEELRGAFEFILCSGLEAVPGLCLC